jgi:hypothetical protein
LAIADSRLAVQHTATIQTREAPESLYFLFYGTPSTSLETLDEWIIATFLVWQNPRRQRVLLPTCSAASSSSSSSSSSTRSCALSPVSVLGTTHDQQPRSVVRPSARGFSLFFFLFLSLSSFSFSVLCFLCESFSFSDSFGFTVFKFYDGNSKGASCAINVFHV